VHEVAAGIVRSAAGSLDDPFTVVHVSDNSLAADPALLADEARSLSLVGGRRVVWVAPAGRGFQGAIESYLADPGGDGLIVAEAGALQKSSKLRTLLRAVEAVCGHRLLRGQCGGSARPRQSCRAEARLAVADDVLEHIVDRIGGDRALSRREIEKLVLYCYGRESIEAG
jgi:DNA polymerase III subunit delta